MSKRKAWGASSRSYVVISEAGARGHVVAKLRDALSPAFAGSRLGGDSSWGSRPRLYAFACFAGSIYFAAKP